MMKIPDGCVFQPSDSHLLKILFRFVTGRSAHDEGLIGFNDIFSDKEPWEMFSSDKTHYFFTQLKRKSKKSGEGKRFERKVGKKRQGNWHGQHKGTPIFYNKALLGYKRSFLYKNKGEREQNGQWLLKEFYLSDQVIKKEFEKYPILQETKDFVLCRLKRKKRLSKDQHQHQESISSPVEIALEFLEGEGESVGDDSTPATGEEKGMAYPDCVGIPMPMPLQGGDDMMMNSSSSSLPIPIMHDDDDHGLWVYTEDFQGSGYDEGDSTTGEENGMAYSVQPLPIADMPMPNMQGDDMMSSSSSLPIPIMQNEDDRDLCAFIEDLLGSDYEDFPAFL